MQTLEQFYEFMNEIHTVRRAITSYYLMRAHNPQHIRSLREALDAIDELPGGTLEKKLLAGGHETTVTLDYERGELEKDIHFLGHSDAEFAEFLAERHARIAFADEVDATLSVLHGLAASDDGPTQIAAFITDRDGTVNNYCGRYRSSHQSVWNAVYLTRFVRSVPAEPVILTSAPLTQGGLLDLTAMPGGTTHYAGSKGREYHSRTGAKGAMEIERTRYETLSELNRRIDALLHEPDYRAFAVIGSGVQHKFGQTTVARQDIHRSIPNELSSEFLEKVRATVNELDPHGSIFGIEDTGKDIEIVLTVEGQREFTKGDGIAFLDRELDIGLRSGSNLICGDTSSDIPMVEKAMEVGGGEGTTALFVTTDEQLRARVRAVAPGAHFVSQPDILVTALHRYAQERTGGQA